MTSYGPLFNLPMLIIGAIGLVIILLLIRFQDDEFNDNLWPLGFIGGLVLWQIVAIVLRRLTYSGGTIEQIAMQETIADIVAYACVVGFFVVIGIALIRDLRRMSSEG